MAVNEALVKKGQREPLVGLRDQMGYHKELVGRFPVELKGAGWKPEDMTAFTSAIDVLSTTRAEQIEARDASKLNTVGEGKAVTKAKAYKRKLKLAWVDICAMAKAEGRELPLTEDAFETGPLGVLGRTTPKLVSYLDDHRADVVTVEALLQPYFGGVKPLTVHDEVRKTLADHQGTQEVDIQALPADTVEVYEAKGRVLTYIERINRLGKIAFEGNAAIAAMFNKDLLLRARREAKAAKELEKKA